LTSQFIHAFGCRARSSSRSILTATLRLIRCRYKSILPRIVLDVDKGTRARYCDETALCPLVSK
jgi:hypothetical protein